MIRREQRVETSKHLTLFNKVGVYQDFYIRYDEGEVAFMKCPTLSDGSNAIRLDTDTFQKIPDNAFVDVYRWEALENE